ncbi:hypothetical protein B0H10DRAFT_2198035 [Mycena sp. CBHHK59/15]|nr:hypothetical protein B0H10DRAFT_2198035 [Mycena sp. CBHHK59/15]
MSMPICMSVYTRISNGVKDFKRIFKGRQLRAARTRSAKILADGNRERQMAAIMQGLDISGVSRTQRTDSARYNPLARPVGRPPPPPPEQDVPPVHGPEVAGGNLNEFELARTCDEEDYAAVEDEEAHKVELIDLDPLAGIPEILRYPIAPPPRAAPRPFDGPATEPSSPVIQPADSATHPDDAQHFVDPLDLDAALTALLPSVSFTPILEQPFAFPPPASDAPTPSTPATTDIAPAPAPVINVQHSAPQQSDDALAPYASVDGWITVPPQDPSVPSITHQSSPPHHHTATTVYPPLASDPEQAHHAGAPGSTGISDMCQDVEMTPGDAMAVDPQSEARCAIVRERLASAHAGQTAREKWMGNLPVHRPRHRPVRAGLLFAAPPPPRRLADARNNTRPARSCRGVADVFVRV